MLPMLGAPGLYGLAATLAAVSATLSLRGRTRVLPVVTCVVLTGVLAGWGDTVAPPQAGPEKSAVYAPGIDHLATRWDPSSRVDVVQYQGQPIGYQYLHFVDPAYTGPRPEAHLMSLDLSAATPILDGRGDMSVLRQTIIAAPYELVADPSVLVIGPGGGVDIQNALVHGPRPVEAARGEPPAAGPSRGAVPDYTGDPP